MACLGAAALGGPRAAAQPSDQALPERLTLSSAIERALAHNPELQAADARWRSMQQRPPQEGALPDPAVTVRYHNEGWAVTYGDAGFSFLEVGVEQEFPVRGATRLISSLLDRMGVIGPCQERSMKSLCPSDSS